ncbi:unnamed protein product [Diplocarpon coronariae]
MGRGDHLGHGGTLSTDIDEVWGRPSQTSALGRLSTYQLEWRGVGGFGSRHRPPAASLRIEQRYTTPTCASRNAADLSDACGRERVGDWEESDRVCALECAAVWVTPAARGPKCGDRVVSFSRRISGLVSIEGTRENKTDRGGKTEVWNGISTDLARYI